MRGNWLLVSNFLTVSDVCTVVSFQCASDRWRQSSHWNFIVTLAWSNIEYVAEQWKDEWRCWWREERKVCAYYMLCTKIIFSVILSVYPPLLLLSLTAKHTTCTYTTCTCYLFSSLLYCTVHVTTEWKLNMNASLILLLLMWNIACSTQDYSSCKWLLIPATKSHIIFYRTGALVNENFPVKVNKVNAQELTSTIGKTCSGFSIENGQPITTQQDETKSCLLVGTRVNPLRTSTDRTSYTNSVPWEACEEAVSWFLLNSNFCYWHTLYMSHIQLADAAMVTWQLSTTANSLLLLPLLRTLDSHIADYTSIA